MSGRYRQFAIEKNLIEYIRRDDPRYPGKLLHYPRMPQGLYIYGRLPDPEKKTVAIVGARTCSGYGRAEAIRFAETLAQYGVQIVSGLAYGIDAWGHQGALSGGGATFAVLGCGVDICYPASNVPVYNSIISSGGGILSEFEPGTPPNAWHFPIRNRIISALSDIVLVVEARVRSGSLITADYALEQGKTVFAVPGRNGDPLSEGCNRLITEGAVPAAAPEQLLEELGILPETAPAPGRNTGGRNTTGRNTAVRNTARRDTAGRNTAGRNAAGPNTTGPNTTGPQKVTRRPNEEPAQHVQSIPASIRDSGAFQTLSACLDREEKSIDRLLAESGLDIRTLSSMLVSLCLCGYAEERTPGFYCRRD